MGKKDGLPRQIVSRKTIDRGALTFPLVLVLVLPNDLPVAGFRVPFVVAPIPFLPLQRPLLLLLFLLAAAAAFPCRVRLETEDAGRHSQ